MITPPSVSIQSISLPNAETSAGPAAGNAHNLSADFANSLDQRMPKTTCVILHVGYNSGISNTAVLGGHVEWRCLVPWGDKKEIKTR